MPYTIINSKVDQSATESLRKFKKLYARSKGDIESAAIAAAYAAKKYNKVVYGYPGTYYDRGMWRITFKKEDALNTVNNSGGKLFTVDQDLTFTWHDLEGGPINYLKESHMDNIDKRLAKVAKNLESLIKKTANPVENARAAYKAANEAVDRLIEEAVDARVNNKPSKTLDALAKKLQAARAKKEKTLGRLIDLIGKGIKNASKKTAKGNLFKKASSFKDFVNAYMETMLWSSIDDDGNPMDSKYSFEDIAPETRDLIINNCRSFLNVAGNLIGDNFDQAGHDFWLTRNGHGAGFWDGDWPEDIGDQLTSISKEFGEMDLYVGDDNLLYLE